MRPFFNYFLFTVALLGALAPRAQAGPTVCEAAMASGSDALELEVDLHLPALLTQMEPVLREKFEDLIAVVRRSPWSTPEQALATILSAHLAIAPNRSLEEVRVPALLVRDTTLWLGERLSDYGRDSEALLLLTHVQEIVEAQTVAYGQYVHLVVDSLRFFTGKAFFGNPFELVDDRRQRLVSSMLRPVQPFAIPVFTHRSLGLRDWGGFADSVQITSAVSLIEGIQTPLVFAEHDINHYEVRAHRSLPQNVNFSSMLRSIDLGTEDVDLSSSQVLELLHFSTLNQALRNQLFASAELIASKQVRQSVTSFLWYMDHEDGDILPKDSSFNLGRFGRSPEGWVPFLTQRAYAAAGLRIWSVHRLRQPRVLRGFHEWYVSDYLPLVRDFLVAHPEYRTHEAFDAILRGINETHSEQP